MQLHERLMDLLGHAVSVTARADHEGKAIPVGTLKEVGPDYLIIGTEGQGKAGQVGSGIDWWVRSAMVVAIIHATDCPKCIAPD
jgi:hypothetical protein